MDCSRGTLVVLLLAAAVAGGHAACVGVPVAVTNGRWPNECANSTTNEVCTLVCNLGYGGPTITTSTCQASGAWGAPTGSGCTRVCTAAPTLAGFAWPPSCAGTVAIGQRCVATCPSGQSGSPSVMCAAGAWDESSLVGKCTTGAICNAQKAFPRLINGQFPVSCIDSAVGTTCVAECNPGYGPGASISCTATGWSEVSGSCSKACMAVPSTPSLQNVDWTGCVGTLVGRRCRATCTGGLQGRPTLLCTGAGWVADSLVGRCAAGPLCSSLPDPVLNGQWPVTCSDASNGQSCVASCNRGYDAVSNSAVATCLASGSTASWVVAGNCRRTCNVLPPPQTGVTWPDSCRGTALGSRCVGTCASGYGAPSIQCLGGQWIPESYVGGCMTGPGCTSMPRARVLNGRWPRSCTTTLAGASCTAVCNDGYGGAPATIACQAGGTWGAASGTCSRVCETDPPAMAGVTWTNCAGVVGVGARCTGTCTAGYGFRSVVCVGSGYDMASLIGACSSTPVCNSWPKTVLNGAWPATCLGTSAGSSCVAVCNPGYSSPGAAATCTANGTSPYWSITGGCNRELGR